ncbi:MAG TPA: alanine glycine permease, partial [Planctomycetes bacterium]|nr:alanine glycine permease [Planctomycetota bacterium]
MGIPNPLHFSIQHQGGFTDSIDAGAGILVQWLASIFFLDVWPGDAEIPMVVAWLVVGAIFFTLKM